ncbi:MAG: hypothetical protein JW778_03680 [Candidatus Altiarchaeota archaeon]|nr:hypothetical protein [Candidatus Altiarchaeota archaeon]
MKKIFFVMLCMMFAVSVSADPPVIHSTWHFPYLTEVNDTVVIRANVTDADGDMTGVYVDIRLPNGTQIINLPMTQISPGTYQRIYTASERGTNQYSVHAVDLLLNHPRTAWNDFFVVKFFTYSDDVLINVYVKGSCCGMISYFYVPPLVIQNQTVVFLYVFKNCGNIPLDWRMNYMKVRNSTGDLVMDRMGQGLPTGTMEAEDEIFYWEIWSTIGMAEGNYTAIGETEYSSTYDEGNITFASFNELNATANCSAIDALNRTNCTKVEDMFCTLYPTSNVVEVNTTTPSAAVVPGMVGGSTAYFGGPIDINGTLYGVYTFDMIGCGEYCHACLSTDINLQSEECDYEGFSIEGVKYGVTDVESDGSSVSFTEMEELCDYTIVSYDCVVYTNGSVFCNYTRYCYGRVREEREFEIVTSFGEQPEPAPTPQVGPYPLIFREMPPQINQESGCNPGDPWNTCTYTKVRLILYNIGIADLTSTSLLDNFTTEACFASDCSPVAYRCVNSPNYTCGTFQSGGRYYVEFNLTQPLRPRHYQIMEYELVPNENRSIYSLGGVSYYQFNASVNFTDISPRGGGASFVSYENDPYFNPPESKRMELRNVPAFNYDISVHSNGSWDRRDFFTDEETEFNLTVYSITGEAQTANAWTANIPIQPYWVLNSCASPAGYSCAITPTDLVLSGAQTPATMTSLLFQFTANVSMETFFLLPVNKSLVAGAYEEYIPGLFLMSREIMQRNITQNITQNVTEPEPEPQPEPQPQPQPQPQPEEEKEKEVEKEVPFEIEVPFNVTQPELELAIDIKPIEREINGSQGMFIPAVFNVTNIGNVEADNISLIPIVPEGWEYKTAFVSYLDVGETTNRTIFVKPPYTVTGKFAIPVKAVRDDVTLDIDYFWLNVIKAVNVSVLEIVEVPKTIYMTPNSNITIPILLENIGKVRLHDITGRLENAELCIETYHFTSITIIDPKEAKSSYLNLRSTDKPGRCPATIIFGSREEAYAFSDVEIIVTPPPSLIPGLAKINLLLVLLIFAGILLAARKGKEKEKLRKMTPGRRMQRVFRYFIISVVCAVVIYVAFSFFGFSGII